MPPSATAWKNAAERFGFCGACVLTLVVVGWVVWLYPFDDLLDRSGTPLGGDYVMLYVAGQTVLEGEVKTLYDDAANQQRSSALFPTMNPSFSWPYRYPPTVAACMVPLASLPFGLSFALFTGIQFLLLTLAVVLLKRISSALSGVNGNAWTLAIVGCPLIIETIIGGQSSLLALCSLMGYLILSKQQKYAAAGAVLAIALYKPNVLALFMIGSVVYQPRLLRGLLPAAAIGALVAVVCVGMEGLQEYLSLGSRLATSSWSLETPFWKVHGIAPLVQAVWPSGGKAVTFGIGTVLSVGIAVVWRRGQLSAEVAQALLLVVNAICNPYVPIYDLVLLIPAVILWANASEQGSVPPISPGQGQVLLGMLFVGPHLSQALARSCGFQLFPLLLIVAVVWQLSAAGKSD